MTPRLRKDSGPSPAGTALCGPAPRAHLPASGWHPGLPRGQQPLTPLCSLPQLGSPQQKPKRLRLLVDVSGSMYRFNGVDGRLERSMEAVCMVMEAFENYEEKFKVLAWAGAAGSPG